MECKKPDKQFIQGTYYKNMKMSCARVLKGL